MFIFLKIESFPTCSSFCLH